MPSAKPFGASEFVPPKADLDQLRAAAAGCRGCDLYQAATQTVFGEGDPAARMLLLGEQPGDQEDRQGRPFVGPAGRILAKVLEEAGIERSKVYVTNAVKHFRFTISERGKRRLHKPPTQAQVLACRPWLIAELQLIEPDVVVCLGATAAKTLFGRTFRLTPNRGRLLELPDLGPGSHPQPATVATIHPSAVLRAPDEDRAAAYEGLLSDLKVAAGNLNT